MDWVVTNPTGGESEDASVINCSLVPLAIHGFSYAVQVAENDRYSGDQNLVVVTNSLGSGASLIFEHKEPQATVKMQR